MNRIVRAVLLAAALAGCGEGSIFTPDKLHGRTSDKVVEGKIRQVSIGADLTEVIAVMGKPSSVDTSNVLGIVTTTLTWDDRSTACWAQFVFDRVVAKGCRNSPP